MNPIALSSSLEDYLEAIAIIIEQNGHAHAKDIAGRLQVKMPSVTNALLQLSQRGLINYQSHAPVSLTAAGTECAAVIRNRHNSLKSFFCRILMLEEKAADEAACKVEHAIGEQVISRIVSLTEAILEREDCTILRDYLAKNMVQIGVRPGETLVPLSSLAEGECGVVATVADNLRGVKKFADLGLVHGSLVQLSGHAPLGDLLRIKVMGCELSMRKKDASYIWVRKTGDEK